MFYPSDSEVKTLPLSEERVKHSSEGCFSGSPKFFQVIGYFFSVRSLTYQKIILGVKSLVNIMNFEIIQLPLKIMKFLIIHRDGASQSDRIEID